METLDWDDLGFFPCSCGYQICRFCWHRLRTDENGLCPACRQAFPDIPVSFNPDISAEELKKQKKRNKERRSNKEQNFKPQDLATLRVVQKNLVFVIGLSSRLTQEDLKKEFAHFGRIVKFVHNKSTAYITYSKPEEAIRAIRTLNASAAHESAVQHLQFQSQLTNVTSSTTATTPITQIPLITNITTTATTIAPTTTTTTATNNNIAVLNNSLSSLNTTNSTTNAMSVPVQPNRLKASLGTTKYCNHFLRSQQCPKFGECMYLHEIAEAEASFTKEQMQAGKHVEYEKKLMDSYLTKLDWQATAAAANLASQSNISTPISIGATIATHNNNNSIPTTTTTPTPISMPMPIPLPIPIPISLPTTNADTTTITTTTNNHTSNLNGINAITSILSQNHNQNHSLNLNHNHNLNLNLSHSLNLNLNHNMNHLSNNIITSATSTNNSTTIAALNHNRQSTMDLDTRPTLELNNRQSLEQAMHCSNNNRQQSLDININLVDSDSDDDGLDFDPITVSISGLRDLLDQQV